MNSYNIIMIEKNGRWSEITIKTYDKEQAKDIAQSMILLGSKNIVEIHVLRVCAGYDEE